MKKILTALLALTLLCSLALPTFAAQDITVKVDDKAVVWTDAYPFVNDDDRTMVPLRAVAEAMGMTVSWDDASETATFEKTVKYATYSCKTSVDFTLGETIAIVSYSYIFPNNTTADSFDVVEMDTAPVLVDDARTYAPMRYLAEAFFYDVSWDEGSATVSVESPNNAVYHEVVSTEDAKAPALIGYFAGESFAEYYGMKIDNVKVNGKAADFHLYTKEELAAYNKAFGTDFYVQLFALKGEYAYGEYTITWDTYDYDKDGKLSTTASENTITWAHVDPAASAEE